MTEIPESYNPTLEESYYTGYLLKKPNAAISGAIIGTITYGLFQFGMPAMGAALYLAMALSAQITDKFISDQIKEKHALTQMIVKHFQEPLAPTEEELAGNSFLSSETITN